MLQTLRDFGHPDTLLDPAKISFCELEPALDGEVVAYVNLVCEGVQVALHFGGRTEARAFQHWVLQAKGQAPEVAAAS